ncbi:MAG: ATP-binding cassette domain-containing protein, partial [Bacillota bacterium]|nr:ATP-binding cassette domain-containing protein [Bacillota bacterium]
SVSYGKQNIIEALSFGFAEKAVNAVVGKSGSGKSTLIKAVASILPHGGQVLWNDAPLDPQEHRVALVPQSNGLIPWKTVGENIALPFKLRGKFDPKAMEDLCEELGIGSLLNQYPRHISGGQCQRAAMARAFLTNPHVLLLDEAFGALDAITRDEAHRVFLDTFRRHPITTVMVTHDIREALTLGRYLLIFRDGAIAEVLENPLWASEDRELRLPILAKEIKEKL